MEDGVNYSGILKYVVLISIIEYIDYIYNQINILYKWSTRLFGFVGSRLVFQCGFVSLWIFYCCVLIKYVAKILVISFMKV